MIHSYMADLKEIFGNVALLYRNFLHWNISKIVIFLYANIVGFIASIPFVGIIVYQYFTSYSKLGLTVSAEEFLLGNIGTVIITVLLLLCIVTIFICTYTYGNFLLQNVYKSYLVGEKLPYAKNLYFSGKHFRAYIGILGWISLYLLAPILVGLSFVIPFGILAKTSFGLSTIVVGSISLVFFIALVVWFLHLGIRLVFSYYTLLYSEEVKKSKDCIDETFRITRGKVWKIIFLVLPFFLVLIILANILQPGEKMLDGNDVLMALFVIFSFLVFEGLGSMIYLSVYKILTKEEVKGRASEEK